MSEEMARSELRVLFANEFCGCGSPEAAWATIYHLLALHPLYDSQDELQERYPELGSRMLMLGRLDELGLTEHGGTIEGGWLTKKGEQVKAALKRERADDFEGLAGNGHCIHGFDFDADHDCMAACRADHASGRLARPKEESSAAVPVGDGVTVNATDLLAVLDAGLPFGSRAYMPIVEARDRLRAALNGEGTE